MAAQVHRRGEVAGSNRLRRDVQVDTPRRADRVALAQGHLPRPGQLLESQLTACAYSAHQYQSLGEFGVGEQEVVAEPPCDLECFGGVAQCVVVGFQYPIRSGDVREHPDGREADLSTARATARGASKSSRRPGMPWRQRVDALITRAIASGELMIRLPTVGSPRDRSMARRGNRGTPTSGPHPVWRCCPPSGSAPPPARDRRSNRAAPEDRGQRVMRERGADHRGGAFEIGTLD